MLSCIIYLLTAAALWQDATLVMSTFIIRCTLWHFHFRRQVMAIAEIRQQRKRQTPPKKITDSKKTSFFHQKARWSCPPLSLFQSLSVTSPDKPVERPFEANLTAGSMQQGSISKGQPNKTSKNETKRHEAMQCDAMQKKNPQPAAAADDDVCYMVNFSCRFGPPTPTPSSTPTSTRTTNCDCFGEYLQRRETRFRKRH